MKTLESIKKENEVIVTITTTGDYNSHQLIMDEDIHSDDISQIMEYTLHRMVESGFSNEEVYYNSGMYIPTDEQLQALKEYGEFSHVDLGYVLGGLITSIE